MSTVSKLMGLVDARSSRGVFSRGKPVYRGGSNSPKAGPVKYFPINKDIKEPALARAAQRKLGSSVKEVSSKFTGPPSLGTDRAKLSNITSKVTDKNALHYQQRQAKKKERDKSVMISRKR